MDISKEDFTILMDRVWKKENPLPLHLKDAIFLPNAKLRRTGMLRELVAWQVRGVELLAKYMGKDPAFPEGMTEEQFVDYVTENEGHVFLEELRKSSAIAVHNQRENWKRGKL